MKITTKFLNGKKTCQTGYKWVKENKLIGLDSVTFLNKLIEHDKLEWANWLIVHVMEYKQYVSYAVFAAEQVIDIYEKKYPNDDRLRKAIEAAKNCIADPSEKNKSIATNAADDAADAYDDTAYDAINAAYSAVATVAAAYSAVATVAAAITYSNNYAYDAVNAAYDVADTYVATKRKEMKLKILNFGISLLEKDNG